MGHWRVLPLVQPRQRWPQGGDRSVRRAEVRQGRRKKEKGIVTVTRKTEARSSNTVRRSEGPAMTAEEFRDAGHALVDRIADLFARMPDGPVTRDEGSAAVRDALNAGRRL